MSGGQYDLGFPTSPLVDPKRKRFGVLLEDEKGRKSCGGRWNTYLVAEHLKNRPYWHSLDDLARFVYTQNTKVSRINVRKHIPVQRRYMLNSLDLPIVTRYNQRGRIMAIKIYNNNLEEDQALLRMDLDRLRDRNEMTQQRYDDLMRLYLLGKPKRKSTPQKI